MPGGIPCRAGYRDARDTVPRGDTVPCGLPDVYGTHLMRPTISACVIVRVVSPAHVSATTAVPAQTWEGWPSPGADTAARCTAAAGCCGPPARRARRYRRCCKCRTCRSAHRTDPEAACLRPPIPKIYEFIMGCRGCRRGVPSRVLPPRVASVAAPPRSAACGAAHAPRGCQPMPSAVNGG